MQGIVDRAWMVERLLPVEGERRLAATRPSEDLEVYFGLGHKLRLKREPGVFEMSPAGLALGACLVSSAGCAGQGQKLLDLGTGSGAHALLARQLGYGPIHAADICERSIILARKNELINFSRGNISFSVSDLFERIPVTGFEKILFNPPGWRTPSDSLMSRLSTHAETALPAHAMFFGDQVLLRFLYSLPNFLSETGSALVGLNSMVGVRDVLERYRQAYDGIPPLKYRLLERHTFPLFLYAPEWAEVAESLYSDFEDWRKHGLSVYSSDGQGGLYWSYEIVEFSHAFR
jgi:release factor glutamine methyltransferase